MHVLCTKKALATCAWLGAIGLGSIFLSNTHPAGSAALSAQTNAQLPPVAPGGPYTGTGPSGSARPEPGQNLMSNPYTLIEHWPTLNPGMKWGAAINFLPDNKGGTWALLRTEPPVNFFDASGKILRSWGQGAFASPHGMCRDRDGNFWIGDSGPFTGAQSAGKGFQVLKFTPEGKLLLTLGQAGVSKIGDDTFIGPTACVALPNGDIIIADGHWPRPTFAPQDGDRLVRYKEDGTFVRSYGKLGRGPGEFMGPHALAVDSRGRLFVADRSNSRIQVFDSELNYLDSWKQFGRPSGIAILKDDTLIVADSESGIPLAGPKESYEGGGSQFRNVGWKQGIRIGSARTGALREFIDGTNPEGMSADENGTIFAGLTAGCTTSRSGGCIQKWVRKK
jgi:sugar lactone lactonase YvrE